MWNCSECREVLDDELDECWVCGTQRDDEAQESEFTEAKKVAADMAPLNYESDATNRLLLPRYADAYIVARTIVGFGNLLKAFALVAPVIVALIGAWIFGSEVFVPLALIIGILPGLLIAVPLYALGLLLCAQGQMLHAVLDTAVNTSPLLSKREIRKVMSLDVT
ncbi:MAG: hypothetical protein KGZ89_03630 [Actinobacteria bacterium]|nr:hypothetical protein [Actinomycetota bacterium]